MLTILHGDNVVKSRRALSNLKKDYQDLEIIELSPFDDLTTVKQAVESNSLFSLKRLVIFENLLAKRGHKKNDAVISYLKTNNFNIHLILWERKEIKRSILSLFKKAKISLFKPKAILFKYLESIKPGNKKTMISLFHQAITDESPELVFFMTVRQIRLLLAVKVNADIPELMRMASWQKAKLNRQAISYSSEELLISLLHKLFTIEFKQKTGQSGMDLIQELDILLANL